MSGRHRAEGAPEIIVVAIDGPAGSGKSSVSKATARRLGYGFLDTGAAYRASTWLALEQLGDDLEKFSDDELAAVVDARVEAGELSIGVDPDAFVARVGDIDVTDAIRETRVTRSVSRIARVQAIRQALTELFRQSILSCTRPGIVVEGRDITTQVAPDAQVRILLTASEEARMARRSAEVSSQPAHVTASQLRSRDEADMRVVDFMNAADGVLTVDSTELDFEQTIDAVVAVVRDETARNSHGL